MPETEADLKAILSSDFKTNVLDNADYGLPTAHLTGVYTATLV